MVFGKHKSLIGRTSITTTLYWLLWNIFPVHVSNSLREVQNNDEQQYE